MDPEEYHHELKRVLGFAREKGIEPKELLEQLDALVRLRAYEQAAGVPERERLARRVERGEWEDVLKGRVALISDIHGNYAALEIVAADLEGQGVDRVICLGDMVDGGEGNEEVVRWIRERGVDTVLGNHDEFNDLRLSEETRSFIRDLPEEIVEGDVVYTHISPRERKTKIRFPFDAWSVFDETRWRITFVGHVHIPFVYGEHGSQAASAEEHPFEYGCPLPLDPTDRYVISVGSVGYPRDALMRIRYGIYDQVEETIELRALEGPLLPYGTAFA